MFLRLVTSAYLKANADDFTPFLFGLEDDPRFFETGAPTLDEFCSFYVEVRNCFPPPEDAGSRLKPTVFSARRP